MQMFILDHDITKNAQSYCDKHVVKIVTEISQILSTVARKSSNVPDFCYKSTHLHHPLVKWVELSTGNWDYTVKLGQAILEEYYFRFEKLDKHLRNKQILKHFEHTFPVHIFANPLTNFIQCFDIKYHKEDAVEGYRQYYINEKLSIAKWTKRTPPSWITKHN